MGLVIRPIFLTLTRPALSAALIIAAALGCAGCNGAAARSGSTLSAPPKARAAGVSLTLRETSGARSLIFELDPDGAVHVGACRVGTLLGRRFEIVNGAPLDLSSGRARYADGREFVWRDDRIEQPTPTGTLSVAVAPDNTVVGRSTLVLTENHDARFDALPAGSSEAALMLAAAYFFIGNRPCLPDRRDSDYYL